MKTFKITFSLLSTLAAFALALPAVAGDKEEENEKGNDKEKIVKLENCPAAVQKTIKDNATGGKIMKVEKETEKDGDVVYEAEVKKTDGSTVDIKVAADGKLIEIEADEDNGPDKDKDKDDDDKKGGA